MSASDTCRHPDRCARPARARGLCVRHYEVWKRAGKPDVWWAAKRSRASVAIQPWEAEARCKPMPFLRLPISQQREVCRGCRFTADCRALGKAIARTWRLDDDVPGLVYGGLTLRELTHSGVAA